MLTKICSTKKSDTKKMPYYVLEVTGRCGQIFGTSSTYPKKKKGRIVMRPEALICEVTAEKLHLK
jgi:hypothetical protein